MASLVRGHERDSGFTAVELIIATVILGIITLPLLSSFVLGIATTTESNQRTQNSADAQIMSTYFASDVASSDNVNASFSCGVSGDVLLTLDWVASPTTHRYVAYIANVNSGATADFGGHTAYTLSRVYCANNSGNGPALTSYDLANTLIQEPQANCDGVACPAPSGSGLSPAPSVITMPIREYVRKTGDVANCLNQQTCVEFTLQGTRRVTTS